MLPKLIPLLPMLALLTWAALGDIRTRRIPNWLTFSLMVSGLATSFIGGPISPGASALGLLVGFAVPLVLFAINAIGGGDVKLLAGVGAWLGPAGVFAVFIVEAVVGMVIVLVQCACQGKLTTLFRNSALLVVNTVHVQDVGVQHLSETGKACRSVDRPLPYAVPVLAATLIVLLWR